MAEYIRLDLFPARVYIYSPELSETVPTARVIVTNDEAFVYIDSSSEPTGVDTKFSGRLDDFTGDNRLGYSISLDGGLTLRVERSGGCGCGSRLRGFSPFPSVPHIARF